MPAHNPIERKLYATKGHLARWRPGTDTTDIDREIKAVRAEDYIKRLVDEAPPLSQAQRDRLAILLRTARTPSDREAA